MVPIAPNDNDTSDGREKTKIQRPKKAILRTEPQHTLKIVQDRVEHEGLEHRG